MKVNQKEFYRTLQQMSKVADDRASLAALRHVHLNARDGKLTIVATDMTQTLRRQLPCDGDIDVCTPVKTLVAMTKPSSSKVSDVVELSVLETGKVEVISEGVCIHLEAFTSAEYPDTVPDVEDDFLAICENKAVVEALAFTVPVASVDLTRPHICCVALRDDLAIATDGHRLHTHPLHLGNADELLVPVASARSLLSILKDGESVKIATFPKEHNMMRFETGDWQLDTKLLTSPFPPYKQILPVGHDTVVRLDADKMFRALKRLDTLAKGAGVRMCVNGAVHLHSEHPDVGDASIIVDVIESNHVGDELHIGFNPAYMLDAIGKKGIVSVEMAGSLDPLVIHHSDDITGVVMPMKI